MIKAETGVLRILNADGVHVGMAIAVGKRHVMTCAHVVNFSLYRRDDSEPQPTATQLISITSRFSDWISKGQVARWGLCFDDRKSVDIAVLELADSIPNDIGIMTFAPETDVDLDWMCLGVAGHPPHARWAHGKLSGPVGPGVCQLNGPPNVGQTVVEGYSGAAIWCQQRMAAVGMVCMRDIDHGENRLAYMIPTETLRAFWQELRIVGADLNHKKPNNRPSHSVPVCGTDPCVQSKEVVDVLVHYLPGRVDCYEICSGLPVPLACYQATVRERWSTIFRYACEKGRWQTLLAKAATLSQLPEVQSLNQRALGNNDSLTTVSLNRDIIASRLRRLTSQIARASNHSFSEANHRALRFIGLSALRQTWGECQPTLEIVEDRLKEVSRHEFEWIYQSFWANHGNFDFLTNGQFDPETGAGVAAMHLVDWFEDEPASGETVVMWLLEHIDQHITATPNREKLLELVLRWWANGKEIAKRWQEGRLNGTSAGLTWEEKYDMLERFIRFDQISRAVGFQNADTLATSSVHWARKMGLLEGLAECLERVGESNLSQYSELFDKVREHGGSHKALVNLARSMRRLIEDGAEINEVSDENLRLALAAGLSDAGPEAINALASHHGSLAWWLDIVPFSANQTQLHHLCAIYRHEVRSSRGRRNQLKAARALAAQFDLVAVSRCLGDNLQQWRDSLQEAERAGDNFRMARM